MVLLLVLIESTCRKIADSSGKEELSEEGSSSGVPVWTSWPQYLTPYPVLQLVLLPVGFSSLQNIRSCYQMVILVMM